jgi:RNA polymerase sigma factor (sigma-70 family)
MSERPSDFALLRDFARHGSQPAFSALAQRHLDLVYSTALRKVEDAGGAQEIAQNVFSVLARKAWQFAPDDSLPAWLHKTTLLESKFWLRGELRRRRREQTAGELGTTMKTPEDQTAFHALVPLLDEALLSLREKDRTALLLRYYERHSLRDVGAAFGVSEDAAQKRVQSALEKLAQFFKVRGFRTASAAATAAAMQHSATSASASLLNTVVSVALESAPTAILGFGGLLARVAGMTRVKTAAVCVALVIMPLVWELNAQYLAAREARRLHAQLLAVQDEQAALQAQIERLRVTSGGLEESFAQANAVAARAAESAQAFEVWKKKIRGQLTSAEYSWDDNSPFARIPKSVLPGLNKLIGNTPFDPPGVIKPYARELLGLSSGERERFETALRDHFADLQARRMAGIYQTNAGSPRPGTLAQMAFVVPELGQKGKQLVEQVLQDTRGILGEERWQVEQARIEAMDGGGGGLTLVNWGSPANMDITVESDGNNVPKVWVTGSINGQFPDETGYSLNIVGSANWKLSMFLPEGDPNRVPGAEDFLTNNSWGGPLAQRAFPWLQKQATVLLRKEAPR